MHRLPCRCRARRVDRSFAASFASLSFLRLLRSHLLHPFCELEVPGRRFCQADGIRDPETCGHGATSAHVGVKFTTLRFVPCTPRPGPEINREFVGLTRGQGRSSKDRVDRVSDGMERTAWTVEGRKEGVDVKDVWQSGGQSSFSKAMSWQVVPSSNWPPKTNRAV